MELLSKKRSLIFLGGSIFFSIMLNIFLLDITSYMIKKREKAYNLSEVIGMVNVVRIKREEVVRKKKIEDITSKQKLYKITKKAVFTSLIPKVSLDIPFELNLKLPPLDGAVKIPVNLYKGLDIPPFKTVFNLSQLDNPLIPIIKIPPIYPFRAKRLGIEGWVKIRFLVDERGRVRNIKILGSHPKGVFEEATVNAVSQWKFKPGTVDGVPVKTLVETTIRFKLE